MRSTVTFFRNLYVVFRILSNGHSPFTPEDFKTLADACALQLPMKYRFTRAELDEIDHHWQRFQPLRAFNGKPQ